MAMKLTKIYNLSETFNKEINKEKILNSITNNEYITYILAGKVKAKYCPKRKLPSGPTWRMKHPEGYCE